MSGSTKRLPLSGLLCAAGLRCWSALSVRHARQSGGRRRRPPSAGLERDRRAGTSAPGAWTAGTDVSPTRSLWIRRARLTRVAAAEPDSQGVTDAACRPDRAKHLRQVRLALPGRRVVLGHGAERRRVDEQHCTSAGRVAGRAATSRARARRSRAGRRADAAVDASQRRCSRSSRPAVQLSHPTSADDGDRQQRDDDNEDVMEVMEDARSDAGQDASRDCAACM